MCFKLIILSLGSLLVATAFGLSRLALDLKASLK